MQLNKVRVLVVDDSGTMRETISGCLRALDLTTIVTVANGRIALQHIENTDLIVSDWDMPEMNGLELLKEVRSRKSCQHIPFIMLTAISMKEDIVSAINAGANDYLCKPFQPKHLMERVTMQLKQISKLQTRKALEFKDLTDT